MMSPKLLLMPLGTGSEARERLVGSLTVAKTLGAHLQVLHTNISANSIVPPEIFVMSRTAKDSLKKVFDQHTNLETERLTELFKTVCESESVPVTESVAESLPGASWIEAQGLRSALIAQFGKTSDLIVLARPSEGKPTASFESAILESGRPVLLIPRRLNSFSLESIAVGWNCSPEASRSIACALPLLQQAKQVVVVSTESCARQNPGPERICEYLMAHGIKASADVSIVDDSQKGEALLEKAKSMGSQLIVLGAYGSSRFRESVFGGVTQYMLRHSKIPLFFSH